MKKNKKIFTTVFNETPIINKCSYFFLYFYYSNFIVRRILLIGNNLSIEIYNVKIFWRKYKLPRTDPSPKRRLVYGERESQKWKLLGCDFISEFLAGDHCRLSLDFPRRQVKWPMQKSHKISYNLAQSASRCSMSCMITVFSLEWTSAPPASMRELGLFLCRFLSYFSLSLSLSLSVLLSLSCLFLWSISLFLSVTLSFRCASFRMPRVTIVWLS